MQVCIKMMNKFMILIGAFQRTRFANWGKGVVRRTLGTIVRHDSHANRLNMAASIQHMKSFRCLFTSRCDLKGRWLHMHSSNSQQRKGNHSLKNDRENGGKNIDTEALEGKYMKNKGLQVLAF